MNLLFDNYWFFVCNHNCTIIFVIILRDQMFINVPFVSTRKRALTKIIKLLNLSKESVLYDLGCGDTNTD